MTPARRGRDDVMPAAQQLYRRLIRGDPGSVDSGTRDRRLADDTQLHVAENGLRQMVANALQSTGDHIVNAKTVLPWLLTALGAPSSLLAMLVPIRESGSMLPQAAISPWVQHHRRRKWIWVAGATGQAFATAAMALTAATASGVVAGVAILLALTVFSLSRALNSLSGKDVLGRTVPKGQRGQINGITTVLSGAVAITVGVSLRVFGSDDVRPAILAALLGVAALVWVAALVVYATIREPAGEPAPSGGDGWAAQSWTLLRDDATFRRFVTVRTLLLVSALSPPFVVAIAAAEGGAALSGLGPFVIAQGVAGLVGGRLLGRLADRSSRLVMIGGAAAASAVIVGFLVLLAVPPLRGWTLLYPTVYLLLALIHVGARVSRKTYVVDLAEGDRRTAYVAVANTAIGVLLLVTGAVSGALAGLGNEAALGFLAALGVLGVIVGRSLPEVSR